MRNLGAPLPGLYKLQGEKLIKAARLMLAAFSIMFSMSKWEPDPAHGDDVLGQLFQEEPQQPRSPKIQARPSGGKFCLC